MASPSSSFSILFFIAIFIIPCLANARESQFFSKATKETTTQNVPNKEQQQQQQLQEDPLTKKQDQQQVDEQPNFIPETITNGYGLYDHETGQLPPSAKSTEGRLPYRRPTTAPEDSSLYGKYDQNNENLYERTYRNNGQNNDNIYERTYQNNGQSNDNLYKRTYKNNGQSNDNLYERTYKNNGADSAYYYNKDSYVTDEERAAGSGNRYSAATSVSLGDRNNYYAGGNSYGNVKQEGMSDTRFMEKGKYFYDINNEEKYHPNFRYDNSRTASSRSGEYNPNGVNGGRYYGNNYRSSNYEYEGNTNVGGYGQDQEEFQNVQDEFVP